MSHDSISRYDGYADRFNVHNQGTKTLKDPQEVLRSFPSRTRDTIEPSQEQLDKEILNRLQASSQGIPYDKLPIIARAGRYIFMAVAVPTHLLVYAIPRWIAVQLIPNTCQMLNRGIKQCFRPIEELVLQLTRQIQRLLKVIKHQRQHVTKALSYFTRLLSLLNSPLEQMRGLWKSIKKKAQEKKKALDEFLDIAKKKILARIKAATAAVKNTVLKTIYGRLNKDEPLSAWRLKLIALVKTIQRAYKYIAELPGKISLAVKNVIIEQYTRHIFPHVEKVRHFYRKVNAKITSIRETLTRTTRKLTEKTRELAKTVRDAIKQSAVQSASFISHTLHLPQLANAMIATWQSGTQIVKKGYGKFQNRVSQASAKFRNLLKKVYSPLQRAKATLFKYFSERFAAPLAAYIKNKPLKFIRSKAENLRTYIAKALLRISAIKSLKDRQSKAALLFKKIGKKTARKARRGIYYTRLSASWTRILTGFWMVSVRNISQNCADHFTWKDILYFMKKMADTFNHFFRRTAQRTFRTNKTKAA